MKVLTFSTLYPDKTRPKHGIFVENRLRQLVSKCELQSLVVAPVPWFPFKYKAFGKYATFASVPKHETRFGIHIIHPRYPLIPKLGMALAPWLMAMAVYPVLRNIIADGYDFKLIDAHYFYPDGVTAALLGMALSKPVVITARGTDINLIPRFYLPRRMIQWAAEHAAGLVTVCQALKSKLLQLGVPSDRISVLRNGVDLDFFRPPENRSRLRKTFRVSGKVLLSVGDLKPLKGHDLAIRALKELTDVRLFIAGDGPQRLQLIELVNALQLDKRVTFLGIVSPDELKQYYGLADVLVLPSSREGMSNVLLEALACGTPVVATAVGGTPEVITAPEAGILIDERTSRSLANGIRRLLSDYPDRAATRRLAETYSWSEPSRKLFRLFSDLLSKEVK